MQIKVVAFGFWREKLAKGSRGRLTLTLPEQASLGDLLAQLNVPATVICSVNGRLERDLTTPLKEGDEVHILQAIGGG